MPSASSTPASAAASPATAQSAGMQSANFKPALDRELSALLNADKQPAIVNVSALAIRDGKVVYHNQFGRATINNAAPDQDRQITDRSLFRIASISKLVVVVGVMKLVEEGRLNLDDDINKHLGWSLRNPKFPNSPITLRQLLSHRSSLTDGPSLYWWDVGINLKDVLVPGGKLYKDGEYWEKDKAPGQWFNYVNLNFGVIATVMERATGERFDKLMDRLVLHPLQMRGGFNPADFSAADVADIATMYRKRRNEGDKEIWEPKGPWVVQADDFSKSKPEQPENITKYEIGSNGTVFGPQGRMRTSIESLGNMMFMLMNDGMHAGKQFIKPESIRAMATEQWRFTPNNPNGDTDGGGVSSWGVGIQRFMDISGKDAKGVGTGDRLVEGGGFTAFGHTGDAYGLMGAFVFDPVNRNGMIVIVCGPSENPDGVPPQWSSMYRWQEIAITSVYQRAIKGMAQ